MGDSQITPLMQQYFAIKSEFKNEFVFFQVGDFYELFFDDAINASKLLSIMLTKRGSHQEKEIPLCGVPMHTIEHYLHKLVSMGHTVVICNQTEEATPGKLVKREVSRIVTPSSITIDNGYDSEKIFSAFLAYHDDLLHVLFFEFITQQAMIFSITKDIWTQERLLSLLISKNPKEILVHKNISSTIIIFLRSHGFLIKRNEENNLKMENDGSLYLEKWNLEDSYRNLITLFLSFIMTYFPNLISLITCTKEKKEHSLFMDSQSRKNLEIFTNNFDNSEKNSLFSVIDKTVNPIGKRTLKNALCNPLREANEIKKRLDLVAFFFEAPNLTKMVQNSLEKIYDLERITGRIKLQQESYQDYQRLLLSLQQIEIIYHLLKKTTIENKDQLIDHLRVPQELFEKIKQKIILEKRNNDEIGYINPNSDDRLFELQQYFANQSSLLLQCESDENKLLSIENGVTIKKTPLYGYVFEFSKNRQINLPLEYTRVQTLSTKERYISPKLKSLEIKILEAESQYKIHDLHLYNALKIYVRGFVQPLSKMAEALGNIDMACSLATTALIHGWTRPEIDINGKQLVVKKGKHPILSTLDPHKFVENDLLLHEESGEKTWIITGPNMGGKSTFMRQNALIVILAHIGSFVPATTAIIPLIDSIFTRIGSSDQPTTGKSTFFCEMEEASHICNSATKKSLVIIDEIGRGTGTREGIAIAGAIIRHIIQNIGSFTLFSTHYHELKKILVDTTHTIKWKRMGAIQSKNGLCFTHAVEDGITEESYSLFVAEQVNLPATIISEASQIQKQLYS